MIIKMYGPAPVAPPYRWPACTPVLLVALVAVAALAALAALVAAGMRALPRLRTRTPGANCYASSSETLQIKSVDVGGLQAARPAGLPCWVKGLPDTPEILDWAPAWGVTNVRMLFSSAGVYAAYGKCTTRREPYGAAELAFGPEDGCASDERCKPVHSESLLVDRTPFASGPMPREIYLRGASGEAWLDEMQEILAWPDLTRISAYLSGTDAVTNLHWDGQDGILAQTAGSKLVCLFSPGTMPGAAPASSPCSRRSYHDGPACPDGAALKVRLPPHWGLYIPAGWAHHITSLSPRTLGSVWRFGTQARNS